jgi:hypothetical protein
MKAGAEQFRSGQPPQQAWTSGRTTHGAFPEGTWGLEENVPKPSAGCREIKAADENKAHLRPYMRCAAQKVDREKLDPVAYSWAALGP